MRRISILLAVIALAIAGGCKEESTTSSTTNDPHAGQSEWPCGTHNGKTLYTGPKGGCYYYNSSGNKTYVDRSECNC